MKCALWLFGKTEAGWTEAAVETYRKRVGHYLPFECVVLPPIKQAGKLGPDVLKQREGEQLLQRLEPGDYLILLDERGSMYSSTAFAARLERLMAQSPRRLIFVVGGAFGFAPAVYARADEQVSLSKMTFSHQMVRVFFLEQLYRAMSILRGEPYHND